MGAQRVSLEVEYGLLSFHCPICGALILAEEEGLTANPCPHLLLTLDWMDELEIHDVVGQPLRDELQKVWDTDVEDGDTLDALARLLPDASILFEFIEPGRGAGHGESSVTFCIDFTRE